MTKASMDRQPSSAARSDVALLVIDMINLFDFPGSADLLPKAREVANIICRLRERADSQGIPTIYVNDNYGEWRSDRGALIDHCLTNTHGGQDIIETIGPREHDLFIIKPQVSGFYATNLPVLLPQLGIRRLILTGIATDICVLFTAADAHMRDYHLCVPSDAVASECDAHGRWALETMAKSMQADIRPATDHIERGWLAQRGSTPL